MYYFCSFNLFGLFFFIIFASKVQIVFAKSISESVEEKGLTFFLDCRTAEHIMEGCFIPYFSVNYISLSQFSD